MQIRRLALERLTPETRAMKRVYIFRRLIQMHSHTTRSVPLAFSLAFQALHVIQSVHRKRYQAWE